MRKPYFDKTIKRKMRQGFLWIPYMIFDDKRLNASDKVVYSALARWVNNETQECYPSKKTLEEYTALTEPTVRKSLYHLRDLGYIEIDSKKGKINYYQLNDPQRIFDTKNKGDTTKDEQLLLPKNNDTNNTNNNNTNKTINIEFNSFWNLYEKKVGLRSKVEKKWCNLTDKDKQAIMDYIPKYKKAQPDKKFRKNPETFFNNRSWEDEIVSTEKPKVKKPFYNDNPMWWDSNKKIWKVIIDGEFKEFAGDEKDIEWRMI